MFNRDSIYAGLFLGCLLPAIAWLVFGFILHNDGAVMNKPGGAYLLTIAFNLMILRYFFGNEEEKTAKGMMLATFAFMVIVFMFKIQIVQ